MFHLLIKNARVLLIWGLLVAVLSAVVSILLPTFYGAEAQVLIISRDRANSDQYAQARSAELVGQTIAQVMQTEDFYNKVMGETAADFDKTRWQNLGGRERQKKWQRDVVGNVVYGTSLLKIRAYSKTESDAGLFATAVAQTVASRGWEYVGADINFKLVDNPVVSPWLTRPNWKLNSLLGGAVGLIIASIWVARYKRHVLLSKI
ncbi:MAG: Wzz/FepE/Etk N-terminal domain-containing protein [Candidatus Magasanikbacteria bacterium]|nr:Wzz/FepE/Etk N-terminal domain-containing protein [Candidatus Magasanikbacteria bacterium]